MRYVALREPRVLTLTPHIPVDDKSERHAYAVLLMYSDWKGGEARLLGDCKNARQRLEQVLASLPSFVTDSILAKKQQEDLFAKIPDLDDIAPPPDNVDDDAEDFDNTLTGRHNNYEGIVQEEVDIPVDCSIIRNAKPSHLAYLSNFLDNQKDKYSNAHNRKYTLTSAEFQLQQEDCSRYFAIENDQLQQQELDATISKFNVRQRQLYDIVTSNISNPNSEQTVLFVSGPGGSGIFY